MIIEEINDGSDPTELDFDPNPGGDVDKPFTEEEAHVTYEVPEPLKRYLPEGSPAANNSGVPDSEERRGPGRPVGSKTRGHLTDSQREANREATKRYRQRQKEKEDRDQMDRLTMTPEQIVERDDANLTAAMALHALRYLTPKPLLGSHCHGTPPSKIRAVVDLHEVMQMIEEYATDHPDGSQQKNAWGQFVRCMLLQDLRKLYAAFLKKNPIAEGGL